MDYCKFLATKCLKLTQGHQLLCRSRVFALRFFFQTCCPLSSNQKEHEKTLQISPEPPLRTKLCLLQIAWFCVCLLSQNSDWGNLVICFRFWFRVRDSCDCLAISTTLKVIDLQFQSLMRHFLRRLTISSSYFKTLLLLKATLCS